MSPDVPEPDDDTEGEFYVQRACHVNYENDSTGIEVDIDLHWKEGVAPEVLKKHLMKAVDRALKEATYLA